MSRHSSKQSSQLLNTLLASPEGIDAVLAGLDRVADLAGATFFPAQVQKLERILDKARGHSGNDALVMPKVATPEAPSSLNVISREALKAKLHVLWEAYADEAGVKKSGQPGKFENIPLINHFDSVDWVDFVLAVERVFSLRLEDQAMQRVVTVGDLSDHIVEQSRRRERRSSKDTN